MSKDLMNNGTFDEYERLQKRVLFKEQLLLQCEDQEQRIEVLEGIKRLLQEQLNELRGSHEMII